MIGNGVPSKVPLLMACHRVIISSVEKESYYYRFFNENFLGIAVPIDDARGMADAILELYNNPEKRRYMSDRAREYSRRHYSATVCTRKFIDLFEEVGAK